MSEKKKAMVRIVNKAANTASGSVVAFDYFNAGLIKSQLLSMCYTRAVLNASGEPITFGIESASHSRKHVAASLRLVASRWKSSATSGRRLTANPLWQVSPPQSCLCGELSS